MEEKRNLTEKPLWFYPLRGAVCFFVMLLIKSFTTRRLLSFVSSGDRIPSQLFFGFALLGIILIYNSLVHTSSLYDRDDFERFKKRGVERVFFFDELRIILCSKEFLLETVPTVMLSVLFSLLGVFNEAVYTVFFIGKAPEWAVTLLPLVSIPILLFLTSLLCRYEMHRYFAELVKRGEEKFKRSKTRLVFKIVIIFLLYPLVFPYSPYVLFLIISFFGLVGTLVSILSVLGFVAVISALVLGIYGILKWKSHRIRKTFFAKLSVIAEKRGDTLTLYTAEERRVRGFDFTLSSAGKSYGCKVVIALRKGVPLYFTPGDAYFLHRIGTKEHHTSLQRHFNYSFNHDGHKLLIIIHFPKRMFVSEGRAARRLYSGDKIWNYIVYDTKDYLGALERECLYRSNDDNG